MNFTNRTYRIALFGIVSLFVLGALWTVAAEPTGQASANSPEARKVEAGTAVKLRLNFRHQPWKDVLTWLAEQADLSLTMEVPPPGSFNYSDNREYSLSEAVDLINSVLLSRGYALIYRDRMLTVANLEDGIASDLIPAIPPESLDVKGEFELVRVCYQLERLKPEEAETEVRKLITPYGRVEVLAASRQLMVTDTAGQLRAIRDALKRMESADQAPPAFLEIYMLRHVDPSTALTVLQTLLGEERDVRLALDPKSLGVILLGPPPAHEKARAALKMLDKPQDEPQTRQLKVFSLMYADVANVAQLLAGFLPKDVQVATDLRTRSLLVYGPEEAIAMAEPLLLRLDQEAADKRARPGMTFDVRIVWLASGLAEDSQLMATDMKDVANELSRLGVKDPRQVGQVFVRCSPQGQFQVASTPSFEGRPAEFVAMGMVAEQRAGFVEMEISLSAEQDIRTGESIRKQKLIDLRTKIDVPPKQYVVLATAPVGKTTSVLVVQVTGNGSQPPQPVPAAPAR